MRRRSLLALAAGGVAGLSGCSALGVEPFAADRTPTAERRGTTASSSTPELPYTSPTAAGNVENARGIEVRNHRSTTAYVTLVVEDGERTVYLDSRPIPPGGTAVHDALVRRRGVYRVLLETARGSRAVHGWVVGEDWLGSKLTAEVTDEGVETRQVAICTPGCPPIESSGTSIDLPSEDNTDPGREVVGALGIRNDRSVATPVDVAVDRGSRTLLDYRYRLPAGVTALIPVAREHGVYDLSIRANGGRLAREWHLPEETYPNLRVGRNGPAVECDRDRLRVTAVRNATGRARAVEVRLRADGRTVAERSLSVPAKGFVNRLDLEVGGTRLGLDVRVGDRTLTADWTLCAPPPIQVLVLDSFLLLRNGERVLLSSGPVATG